MEKKKKGPIGFGKYELTKLIGSEGDFIKIFRGKQIGMGREVELRILTLPGGQKSPFFQRFMQEIKMLAAIDHPAVTPVLDQGIVDDKPYFSTSLRKHLRLSELLQQKGGRLTAEEVLKFAEILTDALEQIHEQNFLHRNINTNTVFYDCEKESPYFGECSVMKDIRLSLTTEGLPYLQRFLPTPERLAAQEEDERTDVFLICSFFYELLSGQSPFDLEKHEGKKGFPEIIPIEKLVGTEGTTEDLCKIIMKGLSLDPDLRQQSAYDLAEDLRDIARAHKVRLLVQEGSRAIPAVRPKKKKAQKRNKQKSSHKDNEATAFQTLPVKKEHLAIGLLCVILVSLLLAVLFRPSSGPKQVSNIPTTTAPSLAGSDDELLALALQTSKSPTTKENFAKRLDIFRRWLVANADDPKPVCSYVELMRLRQKMKRADDVSACSRLDEWITKAELKILDKKKSSP